jgi:AcrR family transcriptional regulator
VADAGKPGRGNQKRRTRKALLEAATRLMKQGRKPSFEEVAEEALVSRATAYRYFPGIEPLLIEASLDVAMPGPNLFDGDSSDDPVARVERAEAAVHDMVVANEAALRMMLIHSLQQGLGGQDAALPARQNRRTPLIEAALAPVRDQLDPAALQDLTAALALVIGSEARMVFKDVLQLDEDEARRVKAWVIRALVNAARPGALGKRPELRGRRTPRGRDAGTAPSHGPRAAS